MRILAGLLNDAFTSKKAISSLYHSKLANVTKAKQPLEHSLNQGMHKEAKLDGFFNGAKKLFGGDIKENPLTKGIRKSNEGLSSKLSTLDNKATRLTNVMNGRLSRVNSARAKIGLAGAGTVGVTEHHNHSKKF